MERYEINKYLSMFKQKIADMYIALKIEEKKPRLDELTKLISEPDFWLDSNRAQKIMSESNNLRESIEDYNRVLNAYQDILELDEMVSLDPDALALLEEEIISLNNNLNELEVKVTLGGKYDNCNAILELHPGAGGTESMDWALMLYRMYTRYAQRKGFKLELIDYLPGEDAGIKSVTMQISGKFAYGLLKGERGVHRLVRISPFNAAGKRQTSFVSCDVAPQIDDNNDIVINDEDLRIDTFCSSGPGGQGVNTTYSAVRITHIPTNIVVSCQNERSQIKNKDICMKLLKSKLAELEIRKQEEEIKKLKGEQMDIGFGSQIRSYVFCPYTMVKDHRTNYETGNIESVMDGNIDEFITAYLKYNAGC
ncbi:MAG: peptide chain release factor 2 [Anaeroplasmataceae bacterium]